MSEVLSFLPLVAVALVALLLPRGWLKRRSVQRALAAGLAAGLAVLVLRYLWWRLTVTVWPAEGLSVQTVFVWGLFSVEMLAWVDATLLFAAFLRRTNRSPEADVHEARLRATRAADLPVVDVFIATYNEPLQVLEKTIVGAMALDWPAERLRVWVLDDGRRDWLRGFCAQAGAGYLTRADNAHAKAGNINAAIRRTDGAFFAIFDADFIPQRNFLYRMMGFFADPGIGIVQAPHAFFNHDPMQASLELRKSLPDDQRLFFDAIMPGRDGWDCAFCCGSNSITRRAAIEAVGGALPAGSITEDMLLTLTMMRKGYITRYLNERLAMGLAAESLAAFFVQRARWARGAIQLLYLREGPLGPGLKPMQRLMFLPTHWLTQSLSQVAAMSTPAIYLLTGILPLVNATTASVFSYQVPAIVGTVLAVRVFAPGQYFPLAATAHAVLQAFRLLPTILVTLVQPHGHAFRVTPKGRDAEGMGQDRPTVILALGLVVLTAIGLALNVDINTRIIADTALVPVVAFWALVNMVVLTVVATIAVAPPALRAEERFEIGGACGIRRRDGSRLAGEVLDLSLTGARIRAEGDGVARGDWVVLDLPEVGAIGAEVARVSPRDEGRCELGLRLAAPPSPERDALIRFLFTRGRDNSVHNDDALEITLGILLRIVQRDPVRRVLAEQPAPAPPDWVEAALGSRALVAWERDAAAEARAAREVA